jgi:hypothetical protein
LHRLIGMRLLVAHDFLQGRGSELITYKALISHDIHFIFSSKLSSCFLQCHWFAAAWAPPRHPSQPFVHSSLVLFPQLKAPHISAHVLALIKCRNCDGDTASLSHVAFKLDKICPWRLMQY